MPTDPSVIRALEVALEVEPDNASLSMHLASLLLDDDPARSLVLARRRLAELPADGQALGLASRAASACGDEPLAAQYRMLLDALTGPAFDPSYWKSVDERVPTAVPGPEIEAPYDEPVEARDDDNVVRLRSIDGGLAGDDSYELERPRITLDDVGGLDDVKRRLTISFLAPLRNPELRMQFGKSLRGGLLLYGPPGCGKTFIARAVAGEVGARFLAVGLSDVLDMYLGESERKLHEIFELARRSAPCVLFIDEVDALGQKRSSMRQSAGRNVVSQLLSELDGADHDNEGVYLLGATNHPWDVDTALRRPGRFDRSLLVLPPDEPARVSILTHHLEGRPVEERLDLRAVARRTEGFSGADLASLCESATELALTDSIEAGRLRPISSRDLAEATRTTYPSTRPWFDIAYNFATFANEGGQYDDLLAYIRSKGLH